eukprot:jgi/Tetstr1/453760/TSEL_040712.t1
MDAWLERVRGWEGRPAELAAWLREATPPTVRTTAGLAALPAALEALDPAAHTLGWLFAAHALASATGVPGPDYLRVAHFFRVCDGEALRQAPDRAVELGRRLKDWAVHGGRPLAAVAPLRTGIAKLRPSPECLTPLHADLFQACLLSHCYHAAAPFLAEEIYNVAPDLCATTPRDFLLYAYYGGMLAAGLKQYDRALELLLCAVTAPATAVSAIAVAAYQKWVLVSLIHTGAAPPLPKYTSSIVHRHVKSECVIYADVAHAFVRKSSEELLAAINSNRDAFATHGNWGLARQCVESMQRRIVGRLTHTHLTLSLQGIADTAGLAGPEAAEQLILQMVEQGEIFAAINPRDGMVSFHEDPERYSSSEMADAIDAQIRRSMALDARLQAINEAVSCDKAYLTKIIAKDAGRGSGRLEDTERLEDLMDMEKAPAPIYI